MKTISIRFNNDLANWIVGNSQKNRITISQFIRDILYNSIKSTKIIISHSLYKKFVLNPHYRNEMGYIIFTAKLLEGFVLGTQEQGEELHATAFKMTKELLEQLNINNKTHEQQFCINLEPELYNSLHQEAVRLRVKTIPLIRKIIEEEAFKELSVGEQPLHVVQQLGIKHQLMACKLLEALISQTIENGEAIIEEARLKANSILLKLFTEQQSSYEVL